jgi:outer membrane translocation and assembly module TamA
MLNRRRLVLRPVLVLTFAYADSARSQAPAPATVAPVGWEVSGIPALNYDADDKFGYGVVLELYNYGLKGKLPYLVTIQPTVFLTTGGRRDFRLFVDAPDAFGSLWRINTFIASETQLASPYYGIGNLTVHDAALEAEPNTKYYRFGRRRFLLTSDVQRRLGGSALRLLLGAGAARGRVDETESGTTTTLLQQQLAGAAAPEGWSNFVRAGLVWDTRDREVHTSRGTWADVLVQRVDKSLGSAWDFTRSTLTVRQYVPLGSTVTLAERVLVQDVSGDAPFYELAYVQTSFKSQEGLGGATTMRGLPKDRFIGKGLAVSNTELRWRAREFTLLEKPASLTLSTFVDAGRVWAERIVLSELGSDLHVTYGVGARVGRGPNFVVALDVGHSSESPASVYVGFGYLF